MSQQKVGSLSRKRLVIGFYPEGQLHAPLNRINVDTLAIRGA
jgi:hypothetical protein